MRLRIARADDPTPLERAPIAVRLQVTPRPRKPRFVDSVAFGCGVVASVFVGVVLIAVAMGWLK